MIFADRMMAPNTRRKMKAGRNRACRSVSNFANLETRRTVGAAATGAD
jgi:hypothetical protein